MASSSDLSTAVLFEVIGYLTGLASALRRNLRSGVRGTSNYNRYCLREERSGSLTVAERQWYRAERSQVPFGHPSVWGLHARRKPCPMEERNIVNWLEHLMGDVLSAPD